MDYSGEETKNFALQFEDGLWTISTVPLFRKGDEWLEKVEIQFVYSKSGIGAIHAVFSKPIYSQEKHTTFRVDYQWIEEEAVSLSAGIAVMFVMVLVASILFLMLSCGVMDVPSESSGSTSSVQGSAPKWD